MARVIRLRARMSLRRQASCLKEGKILALKGLGGFHLACDATSEEAINTLRARKRTTVKTAGGDDSHHGRD